MKSQIQKRKKNGGIVELPIPTLFQKKAFHEETKTYGEIVQNWRTNDQIMPTFGRSFIINDKCIFQ